jgi:hypothetical protein
MEVIVNIANQYLKDSKLIYLCALVLHRFSTCRPLNLFSHVCFTKVTPFTQIFYIRPLNLSYRVCHGFKLTNRDNYFWVDFDRFYIEPRFLRLLGEYLKLARALNRTTIRKFSLPKPVKCSISSDKKMIISCL